MGQHAGLATAGIEDAAVRVGTIAVRWLLVAAYAIAAEAGLIDVDALALALTTALLVSYQCLYTWCRLVRPAGGSSMRAAIRLLDPLIVSVVLVSMEDVTNPVWAIYFINILSVAHIVSRAQIVKYGGWVAMNYAAAAAIVDLGADVSWAYVGAVCALILLMTFNALIMAGGEQRLRDVIAGVATTDSLTGLPNRHSFHANYPRYLDRAGELDASLALMMIDIDYFKQINDRYGHPAGDDKLREVARALQSVVRGDDLVARYGGDEFIIVVPGASRDNAMRLAERLRLAAGERAASLSIGVAMFPEDARMPDALVESADSALYRAKQDGRNCVRAALAA